MRWLWALLGSTKHRYNSTQFSYVGNVDKISLLYEATMVDGKNQSEGELMVSQQVNFINNKPIGRVKYALI